MSGSITATQILKAGAALTAVGVAVGTQISAGSSQAINPSTDLIFPTDLIQANRGYYMNIKFQQYVKRAQINSAIVSSLGGIKLPLPNQLVDNKSVEYTPSDLNPLVGSVVDSIARAQNPNFSFSNDLLSMAGSELATTAAFVAGQNSIGRNLLGATSILTGTSFNPYQSLLFRTPVFREHSFSWRFVPKNQTESDTIKSIIQYLQVNMLPDINSIAGSALFQFPSVLAIQLYPRADYLYSFKPCVLKNVSVNYAPQSTPAFYRGTSAPAAVDISINLAEIELWTRRDYSSLAGATNQTSLVSQPLTPVVEASTNQNGTINVFGGT